MRLAAEMVTRFEHACPSAIRSFTDDREASLAHLKLPAVHRRSIRATNLVNGRASERWRRVKFTEHERK